MPKPPLFTRAFVLAALATLTLSLSSFLFVHLPGFLQQLGAGEAEIGRIMGAQALGAILAWPLVGKAMDARGRRVVIVSGCVLFVLVVTLYLYIDSLGPFVYAVRLLDGVAHTMWYTALFTYGADLVPEKRRTEGLAIFGISGLVTIGLGAQFGDAVLAYASYRELFTGAIGLAVLGLFFSLPLQDVRLAHADLHPSRGMFAVAAQSNLLPVWIVGSTFFISLATLFSFMKTYISATEIGTVGSFFTAYSAVAVILRLFVGWLPDRLGAKRMLGIAMLCYALGFTVLSMAQSSAHILIAGFLCGTGHGYTYPVLFSLVVERAPSRERGSAMAFYTAIDWLGLFLAGPIFGYLIEIAGYKNAFVSIGFVLVTGICLFYGLDRRAKY